jgi:hypothetical protein
MALKMAGGTPDISWNGGGNGGKKKPSTCP